MDQEKSKKTFFIIASVCVAAVTAAALILIFRVMNVMDDLSASVSEINTLVKNAETLLKNGETLMQNADTTLKSIEQVDFETLNRAISDFAKVVQPLAKMFGG